MHCLAEDAKTVISPYLRATKESTLLKLIKVAGADAETLQKVRQRLEMGRGTVAVDVTEDGQKLLQIFDPPPGT